MDAVAVPRLRVRADERRGRTALARPRGHQPGRPGGKAPGAGPRA
ncbi:hypothetical protein STTU_1018 [Streptomyces sp. Tu6071]|nr:hypothetical protein STTU_1018 [Streptomyces sp. Tu6071]